jgi:hypothetical protein
MRQPSASRGSPSRTGAACARASPQRCPVFSFSGGRSVDRTGRGGVDELPDGVRDPAPKRHAVVIAGRWELVGPRGAFLERLLAIALEHQVGGAPDVDLGDRIAEFSRADRRLQDGSIGPELRTFTLRLRTESHRPCGMWSPTTRLSHKASCPHMALLFVRCGSVKSRSIAPQARYFFAPAPAFRCGTSRRTSAVGLSSRSPS